MKKWKYILVLCLMAGGSLAAEPTFGDLAVLLAKGYFGSYIKPEASLEQCVVFLNKRGIYFSLFDLIDPNKTVKKKILREWLGSRYCCFRGKQRL